MKNSHIKGKKELSLVLTHCLLLPLQPATTPSCNALLTPGPPHLLRTTPGSTPSTPGHILLTGGTSLKGVEERLLPTLIPTNMQSLVNQIQQAQVHTCAVALFPGSLLVFEERDWERGYLCRGGRPQGGGQGGGRRGEEGTGEEDLNNGV